MVPEGRSGGRWSFPRSVLVSGQGFSWHSVSGQHCLERQAACPGGGGGISSSKKLLQEGMGGTRPAQQVGGRALSGCQTQTSNNSVIKSWDIIYPAGPFLQTQMFEHEGVQPSLEAVILSLKPFQIFLVCIFKLMVLAAAIKRLILF